VFAVVLPLCFNLLNLGNSTSKEKITKAEDMPPQVVTQAVNDADAHISFGFSGGKGINPENYKEYVFIKTMLDEIQNYRFSGGINGDFTILAPANGYTPGDTYIMTLNKGVRFKDESYITDGKFYFTIKRAEVVDVQVKENVKVTEGTPHVEFVNTDTVIVFGIDATKCNVGDIMVVVRTAHLAIRGLAVFQKLR
jgi:ABC-type transport system substrate-binding protein